MTKNKDAGSSGVAELAELIEAGGKAMPGRPSASLAECLQIARARLRAALTTAGIAEYRAMVKGKSDALSDALSELDAAYATLWAYEAAGAKVRVHDVEAKRVELLERIEGLYERKRAAVAKGGSDDLSGILEELLATHAQLSRLASPTEDDARFPRPSDADASSPDASSSDEMNVKEDSAKATAKEVRARLRKNGRLAASESLGGGGLLVRSSASGASAGRMLRLRSRRLVV